PLTSTLFTTIISSTSTYGYLSRSILVIYTSSFFFFNDPSTTEIYTLSLHDALPILKPILEINTHHPIILKINNEADEQKFADWADRKSTRLNSSHLGISYAVFCLKKKKNKKKPNN